MNLYHNIKNRELPTILRVAYEQHNGNIEEAAADLATIDHALGVIKNRTLIHSRCRKSKANRWSTNRNFRGILENIILQRITMTSEEHHG